ncbi:hypothetical protein B0H11DRAFT_1747655, partial [Mycena galericulata]
DYFRFDIGSTRSSPWNKSAARVFADLTIRQLGLPNTVEMYEAIRHAFTAHLDTIIRRHKESLKPGPQQAQHKSKHRRQTRKYELFHRRRYIAYMFKPFRRHIDMLEHLGIDGMSSDESETEDIGEDEHIQYHILSPQWRAGRVAPWVRTFDSIHNILRKSGESQTTCGSFPRNRKMVNRKSTSIKFVAGLPINTYDPEWMERDPIRKYNLRPLTQQYDFTHDEDVLL